MGSEEKRPFNATGITGEASSFAGVWPDLYSDIQAAREDLIAQGYEKILTLWPGQVILKEIDNKYGFYTLIANNQAKELQQIIQDGRLECVLELGREGNIVVALVTLKDPEKRTAVFCPLNYSATEEQDINEKTKGSLYIFFRILTGEIVATVHFENFVFPTADP